MRVSKMAIDFGRFLIVLTSLLIMCVGAQFDMDQCSWTIWDNKSDMKSIRNILAQCTEGDVTWNTPNGALRVTMQFQTPEPFRGCFKASAQYTGAKISRLINGELHEIISLNGANSGMRKETCFDSVDGEKIILFIEASAVTATTGRISIAYDLERISSRVSVDGLEECRPCTDEEILDSYCTSDFVVVGTLEKVHRHEDDEESELQLLVRKIHHQKTKQFKRDTNTRGKLRGNVIMPLKCGAHSGTGEFLITGKIRLGRSFLQCAPRIEDWEKIRDEALRTGNSVCSLDD